ncbi:MAG: hypothetical protein COB36_10760 [Alphaproteobacteria bacterium]|nr:MAG: hypothetical protein COB36_10760 [Alphaproteobacteria bacterium]
MDINNFKTDVTKAEEGIKVPLSDGVWIQVRRKGCEQFQKCYERLQKPYALQIRKKQLDEETAARILWEAVAEGLVVDWSGFEEGGKTLKFSTDNAKRFLCNDAFTELREIVLDAAGDMDSFRAEVVEGGVKN